MLYIVLITLIRALFRYRPGCNFSTGRGSSAGKVVFVQEKREEKGYIHHKKKDNAKATD